MDFINLLEVRLCIPTLVYGDNRKVIRWRYRGKKIGIKNGSCSLLSIKTILHLPEVKAVS
jgi:hypothetical protein